MEGGRCIEIIMKPGNTVVEVYYFKINIQICSVVGIFEENSDKPASSTCRPIFQTTHAV